MLDTYSQDEIDLILHKNFYVFQQKHQRHKQVRMKTSFTQKCKQLQIMRYLTKENKLTEKGEFVKNIYFKEILIGELFATPLYKQLTNIELIQIIAAIVYEKRPNDHFSFKGVDQAYQHLMKKINQNTHFFKKINKLSLKRMMSLVASWGNEEPFEDLLELTTFREGDIVRLFRRIIDMLQQIRRATEDEELQERLMECQALIDRDIVAIEI